MAVACFRSPRPAPTAVQSDVLRTYLVGFALIHLLHGRLPGDLGLHWLADRGYQS